jgi:hypothetical protein
MNVTLRISGVHHQALKAHLFPGDGLEAVAFALCGRHRGDRGELLTVHRLVPVPHELCRRAWDHVTWPTDVLARLLDEAKRRSLGVVKFHSHTGSYGDFSPSDDASDRETFSSVSSWLDDGRHHGSAVMLPDGRVFGRSIADHGWEPFAGITLVSDDISYRRQNGDQAAAGADLEAQRQLFGAGTTNALRKLRVGVVGVSGTGSIVVELLARLGVGALLMVDDDTIEERNLNRILNSKRTDIGRPKVAVLAEAVQQMGLGTEAIPLALNLYDRRAVGPVAECDVVFGCMDTAEGRHLLNRIATFYLVPYFDLGVHLSADGSGNISEASGVVHYVQPGRSSLLSRKAYTPERVRAENLHRTDPAAYRDQREAGYLDNVDEHSPAVASVNAAVASLAVNEFLARVHPFRSCGNGDCATSRLNFMEALIFHEDEGADDESLRPHVGKGGVEPLLDWPSLSK